MAITSYSQVRTGPVTLVTVVSDLTGIVFYHWYVDGAYAVTTTAPTHGFTLEVGEQVRIEVLDTNDADFDPIANAPDGWPARVSLWWTRSESPDAVRYLPSSPMLTPFDFASVAADPGQWSFSVLSPRLDDGVLYLWDVFPVDAAGNKGPGVGGAPGLEEFLRTPDAPNFTAVYSGGTQRVTFAAA